jgi:hypothetical protein
METKVLRHPEKYVGIELALIETPGKYGLVAEVVLYALKYMKDNPKSSIEDAMGYGFDEWVK